LLNFTNGSLKSAIRAFPSFVGFSFFGGFKEAFVLRRVVRFWCWFARHRPKHSPKIHLCKNMLIIEAATEIAAAISAAIAIALLLRAAFALRAADDAELRAMTLASEAVALAERAKSLASRAKAKLWALDAEDLNDSRYSSH